MKEQISEHGPCVTFAILEVWFGHVSSPYSYSFMGHHLPLESKQVALHSNIDAHFDEVVVRR